MRTLMRSFAGGEVAPELFARIDDTRYQTGLALARNLISLPHGPVRNRPGGRHVAVTKDSGAKKSRLLTFIYSTSQAYVIEMGAGYFRFYQNRVPIMVTDDGVPPAYKPNRTFTNADINIGTEEITFGVAHGGTTGDPVRLTNDAAGAAPPNTNAVTVDTVVYIRAVSPTVATFHLTQAGAIGNTLKVNFTAPPVANYRLNFNYPRGSLVEGTPAGAPGYHYCLQDPTVNGAAQATPGNVAYWYLQPTSGVYEIPNTFIEVNLPFVRYFQSNDVMTILHNDNPIRTLRRYGQVNWQLVTEPIVPTLVAPTNLAGTPTEAGMSLVIAAVVTANPLRLQGASNVPWINGESIVGFVSLALGGFGPDFHGRAVNINGRDFDLVSRDGTRLDASALGALVTGEFRAVPFAADTTNKYRVTAVDARGNESQPSGEVTVTNNLYAEGAYNTLTWSAVVGASKYRVYRQQSGVYGWIGTTDAAVLTFKDDHVESQLDQSIPMFDATLASTPFPDAGCYHEQRKVFARDQLLWLTRPGTEIDFTFSLPVKDDDRISFGLAATEFSRVMHVVSMGELIVLTTAAEFAVSSPDTAVLTPSSILVRPQSFIGSSHIRPVLVNNSLVYCAARGGHIRELGYQATVQGFNTGDLSLRATHLFDNRTIVDLAFSKAPYPIVWAVSSTGLLLGLTYVPDQQVAGWHQHPVGGSGIVEACCVVPEGNEDLLYWITQRTINGQVVRHIECMAPMALSTTNEHVFVDNAKVFNNVPAGYLSGLLHLVGQTVSILADGIVLPQQVVDSLGRIRLPTLKTTYLKVVAGLPIDAQLQTLPIAAQVDGFGQGRQKNIGRVWVRTVDSSPFWVGPALDELSPPNAAEPAVRAELAVQTLQSGSVLARSRGQWTEDGQVYLRHTLPLPLTVTGITLEVGIVGIDD